MPKRLVSRTATRFENAREFMVSETARASRRQLWLTAAVCGALAAISCAAPARLIPAAGYELRLGRQHPLVGRVYAVQARDFVAPSQLSAAVSGARIAILGETHDNPDHHQLQAELLDGFLQQHPRARVAFEMLDEEDAGALATADLPTPEAVAARVAWDRSGWPEFRLYRPVFAVALARHAPLLAAHPSAEHVRDSMRGVEDGEARALKLDEPLPAAQLARQRDEIREAHCGHGNDAMLAAMQRAQVYKDAFMARALVGAGEPVLLIAGRGHARRDRAVPYFLRRHGAESVSVAFIDVSEERVSATDYDVSPFDFVVFTPRVSDEDPCETFRKQLEQMHRQSPTDAGAQAAAHDK